MESFWAKLVQMFPAAQIQASSIDDFVREVMAKGDLSSLPLIEGELGDSWLYGACVAVWLLLLLLPLLLGQVCTMVPFCQRLWAKLHRLGRRHTRDGADVWADAGLIIVAADLIQFALAD